MKKLNSKDFKLIFTGLGVISAIGSAVLFHLGGVCRGTNLALDTIVEHEGVKVRRDDDKVYSFYYDEIESE